MILCISHSDDFYTIDIVVKRLKELGKEVVRLNSDKFSEYLSFEYKINSGESTIEVNYNGEKFTAEDVEAVWYRKLWGVAIPEELDSSFHGIYRQEYTTMRNLFFESISHVPWMNVMDIDHKIGENKFDQLNQARNAGLTIPESLFTNNQEEVKSFFYTVCNEQMIAKLHGALSRSMSGNTPMFPTTLIREEDLESLDTLPYCPMIFQRAIDKSYELRIAYVDGTFFPGKINATKSEIGKTDWRIANDLQSTWEEYILPDAVCNSLTQMMTNMGLQFGVIDMIRDNQGEYVFLEVNPQGEWGMIQRDLGYPIGETIAEKLVARIR
jgi:hypothetical protein